MSHKLDDLDKWLNVETWYTGHHLDDERFYKAVYALLLANKDIDGEEIGNYIEARYTGKLADELLFEVSQRAVIRFEIIRGFCTANNITKA